MRKILLLALLLSSMITSAQTFVSIGNCKAAFKYEVNNKIMSPIAATAINFYDRSEGNGIQWFWDFGDGNTSNEQNPMFMFPHPLQGSTVKMSPYRTVSLTILTTDGCKSMYSEVINIMDGTTYPQNACQAAFKYYQTKYDSIAKTATFQLTNLSVGDSLQYAWNFMDGKTSTDKEPTVTFDLSQPERKVCLTVKGSNNCSNEFCDAIYINNPYIKVDTIYPQPVKCETAFGYSVNYTIKPFAPALVLDFYSKAYPEPTKYKWDFGDGTTSEEANPTHLFNFPLIKDSTLGDPNPFRKVCLTVETATGCVASNCQTINIYMDTTPVDPNTGKCETNFGYTVDYDIKTFAPALALDFYSKAYPEATKYRWDFGDGITSEETNPTHLFNFPLVKDSILGDPNPFRKVCLTVETATGCIATHCETIDIYMNTNPVDPATQCHAWIKYYPVSNMVTIPEVVAYKLVDASEGKVLSRLWKFEDGTTSTEAEPVKMFDIFKPRQQVCLSIQTEDGCSSSWCETIYVSGSVPPDSGYTKPANVYTMRYESSFPIYMSSCAGWAKAQVYRNDTIVKADSYKWSNGTAGQEVKGLCPTQMYTVKAIAFDGTYVSGTFLFNSDGTVTDAPFNWWVSGGTDNEMIKYDFDNKDYSVEWRLCDGTIVKSDSMPLNSINCGGNLSNMIVKDASGTVVYSEAISEKTLTTDLNADQSSPSVKLYPNPVKDVLNILYAGNRLNEMQLEICDMSGRSVSLQKFYNVESGQQISLNVNSLPKGIYLCKMIAQKQVIRIEKFSK
ncbi:MAG TPA: PKD domain-containing protein [Prolixibacteraceae bacterium]